MNVDLHAIVLAVGGTAAIGKVALIAARTMPPPPESCGFWCRWLYDFVQNACENPDKVGRSQDPNKPIGIEKQSLTVSKATIELPQP